MAEESVANNAVTILSLIYDHPIFSLILASVTLASIIILVFVGIPKLAKYFKKIGPVELAGVDEDSNTTESVNASLKERIDRMATQIKSYTERHTEDRLNFKTDIVNQQLKTTELYISEARDCLIKPYSDKILEVKNLQPSDLSDIATLLGLFLERDFNSAIYKQIETYVSTKILADESDEDFQREIERIARSATNTLKVKFMSYPSMIDNQVLSAVYDSQSGNIEQAISDSLRAARHLSKDGIIQWQEMIKEYNEAIDNSIKQAFGLN